MIALVLFLVLPMGAIAGSTGGNAGAQSIPTAVAEKGVTPAIVDSPTLLMEAARRSDPDLIRVLAAAGADVNARFRDGTTALVIAITDPIQERPDVIRALIEVGADVNTVTERDGMTPLMMAAELNYRKQYPEIVRALIAVGADVNARNRNGQTPLMVAMVRKADTETIEALVEAGADVNQRLEDGTTALMIAVSDTNKDRWAVVKALIEAGADVNAVSKKGNTPLILAAGTYRQSPNLVKALIEAGADVNAASNDGATPLMMAVKYNSLEVVKMLLEAGARPNAR